VSFDNPPATTPPACRSAATGTNPREITASTDGGTARITGSDGWIDEGSDVAEGARPGLDRRRRLHRDILANLPTQHPQVSSIAVPAASIVEQMAVRRAPVTAFAARSPAAIAYSELWAEITDLLAVRSSTAP
jgi:hypothetical protein